MKIKENPRIAQWATKQVQEKMFTRDKSGPFHASEITQCLRKTILNRRDPIKYDLTSVNMFAVGFAMQEWFLGEEEDSQEAYGILFSPDKEVDGHILEFKTSRSQYEKYQKDEKGKLMRDEPKVRFDPSQNESWMMRTGIYAALTGSKVAHILVFFLYSSELHAYTIEYTDADLEYYKNLMLERKAVLDETGDDELPPAHYRLGAWECERCPYLVKYCSQEVTDVRS